MQDCSNSIANALELLQSSTKPSKYPLIWSATYIFKFSHELGKIFQAVWGRTIDFHAFLYHVHFSWKENEKLRITGDFTLIYVIRWQSQFIFQWIQNWSRIQNSLDMLWQTLCQRFDDSSAICIDDAEISSNFWHKLHCHHLHTIHESTTSQKIIPWFWPHHKRVHVFHTGGFQRCQFSYAARCFMTKIVSYQTTPVWFVKSEPLMAKIYVLRSVLPSNRVTGWDIKWCHIRIQMQVL